MSIGKVRYKQVATASLLLLIFIMPMTYFAVKAKTRLIGFKLIDNPLCYSIDSQTGVYEIKPNCAQRLTLDGRQIEMKTDEHGFRSTGSPVGRHKVLVLGGSILSGFVLSDEQLRPVNALAQYSQAKFPNIQWINASVQGHTATHMAIRLPKLLDKFKPALVVVDAVRQQHLLKDAALFSRIQFDADHLPRRLVPQFDSNRQWFEQGLSLGLERPTINDLLMFFDTVATARKINHLEDRATQIDAWVGPGLELLRSMKNQAAKSGAELVVLIDGLPVNQNISVNEEVVKPVAMLSIAFVPRGNFISASELAKQFEKFQIPTVQFPETYTAALQSSEYLLADGYHLNEKGAALFGENAFSLLQPRLERINSRD